MQSSSRYPRCLNLQLLLCALGLVVFARCFGSEFVFDSTIIVQDDPRLQSFSFENLRNILTQDYWWPTMGSDLYRPVTTFSFFLERAFFGYGARVALYQLTNLVFHLGLTCVGFSQLKRLGLATLPAFLASAWFLIHPYATEVVPNVVGRADLFAFGAIIWSLKIYLDWLESPKPRWRTLLWFVVVVLGCLAKESAFSAIAICLWHACTLGREQAGLALARTGHPRVALVATAIATGLALLVVLVPKFVFADRTAPKSSIAGDNPLVALGWFESRIGAASILGDNLVNTIIPYRVSADYSDSQLPLPTLPPKQSDDYFLLVAALLTLGVGAAILLNAKRYPRVAFFFGASFLALLPTANLVVQIGTIRADRLVYPAIWFMGSLAALGLHRLLAPLRQPARLFLIAGVTTAVLCLAVFTHFRCVDWRTGRQFWESTYASSPKSFKTKLGYGNSLIKGNDPAEALAGLDLIEESIRQVETSSWVEEGGASILSLQIAGGSWLEYARQMEHRGWRGDRSVVLAKAEAHLRRALTFMEALIAAESAAKGTEPHEAKLRTDIVLCSLAEILLAKGEVEEAVAIMNRHARQNYFMARYHEFHGWALAQAGQKEKALNELFTALILAPDNLRRSREIAFYMREGVIPSSQKPLAGENSLADTAAWPLLDIALPEVEKRVRRAAQEMDSALREKKRFLEAVRLNRRLRGILRGDIREPNSPPARSEQTRASAVQT